MNKRQRHALTNPLIGDTRNDLAIIRADQVIDRRVFALHLVLSTLAVDR
jgi:hypothetical protein